MKKTMLGIVFILLLFFIACTPQDWQTAGGAITQAGQDLNSVPASIDPNVIADTTTTVGQVLIGAGVKAGFIVIIVGAILRALFLAKKKKGETK